MRAPVTFHPINGPNHIYLESYKEWLAQKSVTPNTLRAYHSRIKQFLLFIEYANLNEQPLEDLNSLHAAMTLYLKFLKQAKGTAKSVNANINALNNFSHFLGLQRTQLKRERCYHKPAKVLSHPEQNQFLKSVERQESVRDKALALVLLSTGLRIGDCARLNVEDILLDSQSQGQIADHKANDNKTADKKISGTSGSKLKTKDNEHKPHSHGGVACIHLNDGDAYP